jgi:hypothetical protein
VFLAGSTAVAGSTVAASGEPERAPRLVGCHVTGAPAPGTVISGSIPSGGVERGYRVHGGLLPGGWRVFPVPAAADGGDPRDCRPAGSLRRRATAGTAVDSALAQGAEVNRCGGRAPLETSLSGVELQRWTGVRRAPVPRTTGCLAAVTSGRTGFDATGLIRTFLTHTARESAG